MIQHVTENKQVLKGINQPLLCDKELVKIFSGGEGNTMVSLKTLKETISYKKWSDLVQEYVGATPQCGPTAALVNVQYKKSAQ